MANPALELFGGNELRHLFKELPKRVAKKALRAAVTAATTPINRAAKAKAPRDSGLLKKAMGRKIKSYRGAAMGIVGARTSITGMVKSKGAKYAKNKVPANYLHLVTHGTKPHMVGSRMHPGTAANNFLRIAYTSQKQAAQSAAQSKLRDVIESEAKKLGKK